MTPHKPDRFTVGVRRLNAAFLYDFMAVSVEQLYDRVCRAHAARSLTPMDPGNFVNSVLARGIYAAQRRHGIAHTSVSFTDDWPAAAFEPLIATLHAAFNRSQPARPDGRVMDRVSYCNWLMLTGISEVVKELIADEKWLDPKQADGSGR